MSWLAEHWWIILLVLCGMFINGIKALLRVDHKPYLVARDKQPEQRDNNAQWDDEEESRNKRGG